MSNGCYIPFPLEHAVAQISMKCSPFFSLRFKPECKTSLVYVTRCLGQIINISRKQTGRSVSEQVNKENTFVVIKALFTLERGLPRSTRPVFIYRQMEEVTHLTKSACKWTMGVGFIKAIQASSESIRGLGLCCETLRGNIKSRGQVDEIHPEIRCEKLYFFIRVLQERSGDQHTSIFIVWRQHSLQMLWKCFHWSWKGQESLT